VEGADRLDLSKLNTDVSSISLNPPLVPSALGGGSMKAIN